MPPTPTPSSPSRPAGAPRPARSVRLVPARGPHPHDDPEAQGDLPLDDLPLDETVLRVADLGAIDGPASTGTGIAGALRAASDEVVETAQTVTEDLGHAFEETVGELLDAAFRLRAGPRDALAIAATAAGHVVEGWIAADRHAAGRVVVAGRRLVALLATGRRLVP